ncbi:hypothetical protein Taro_040992, partial [Colocasia esculenta]|nr:hypothetical protein [Colocasia esculenta]
MHSCRGALTHRVWFRRLKALADDPFFPFFFLFPFLSSGAAALAPTPVLVVSFAAIDVGELLLLKLQPPLVVPEELQVVAVHSFSMLPSPVWYVCGLWAAPGWSIPWVCLSAGVVTAVRVATPEEAFARVCCHDTLPRRDRVAVMVPLPVVMGRFALRTFRWGTRQVASLRSVTEGDTFMVVFWRRCQEARVYVVSVVWDPHPREPIEGVIWATSVLKLACNDHPYTDELGGKALAVKGLTWRTLELRGKRGLDSGAESFVEHSCPGRDAEVVEAVLFPAWPRQSFVTLPLSALVSEPRSGARRGAAAWPGCGGACILVVFYGGSVSLFRG